MANDNKLQELISLITESLLGEENPQRLRDIFINPTKDLINTVGYAAERLSASAQKTIKGLSLIIPTLLIPGIEFRYDLFAKDEQEKLDAIKKKYGETLSRNWEAIKDPDVFGFLFLAYPETMLGFSALKKSPLAFLRVLEVVTGGLEPVRVLRQNLESTSAYTPRQTQYMDPNARSMGAAGGGNIMGDYYGDYGGTGLSENQQQVQNAQVDPNIIAAIQQLMANPQVQQAINKSPILKDMKNQAVALFVDPILIFNQAKSINDLGRFVSSDALLKIKNEVQGNADYKMLSAQEKKLVNQTMFSQIKQVYKNQYIKWLSGLSSQKPEIAPVVSAAIAKIKAIK